MKNLFFLILLLPFFFSCDKEEINLNTGWEFEVQTSKNLNIYNLNEEFIGCIEPGDTVFCFPNHEVYIDIPTGVVNFWHVLGARVTPHELEAVGGIKRYYLHFDVHNVPKNCQ